MMAEPILESGLFQNRLEQLFRQIALEDPLQRMRARAWDHFLELGLPTRKSEVFRYLKMKKLFAKELTFSKPSEVQAERISPRSIRNAKALSSSL